MDLAIGARDVWVMMKLFRGDGSAKLVTEYSYPLTGLACVSRVYTEYGVFLINAQGLLLRERPTASRRDG